MSQTRLLVLNPNTSAAVTDGVAAHLRTLAPPGVTITAVTAPFGPAIVGSRAENIIAGHAALTLLARHADDHDAVILAISFDTALEAMREVSPVPVVAITQTALNAALMAHERVGMVIFGGSALPLYEDLLLRYGLRERISGIEVLPTPSLASYLSPEARDEAVLAAVERLSAHASAVVICGAAVIGTAARLGPRAALPLFDGGAPALAAALAALDNPVPASPPPVLLGPITGVDPALATFLARNSPDLGRR